MPGGHRTRPPDPTQVAIHERFSFSFHRCGHFKETTRTNNRRTAVASVAGRVAGLSIGSLPSAQAGAAEGNSASQPSAIEPLLDPAAVSITWRGRISGLTHPIQIVTSPDSSGRKFVVQSTGRIVIEDQGALLISSYLNTSTMINPRGNKLRLSMVFAHDFAMTGRVHTSNQAADGTLVVTRWTAPTPAADSIPASARQTLLTIPYPAEAVHVGTPAGFRQGGLPSCVDRECCRAGRLTPGSESGWHARQSAADATSPTVPVAPSSACRRVIPTSVSLQLGR